ncbi:hypothetical protein [Bacillus sp. V2I10]|uniref:hypothetical protein n=1 Tax=Bacillus sp. V2I10 TaxID=3042276 RepID=UPI0027860A48|nr:hypothetical protein [Bacillus sp. V2I10]MDQ0860843.1 hypothetical protein [Bacillus sp. V2I10]
MKRNPYVPLIAGLNLIFIVYLVVNTIKHVKVYLVYSSGLGPFIIGGLLLAVIVVLIVKGSSYR